MKESWIVAKLIDLMLYKTDGCLACMVIRTLSLGIVVGGGLVFLLTKV
jgi:hypothetical protein